MVQVTRIRLPECSTIILRPGEPRRRWARGWGQPLSRNNATRRRKRPHRGQSLTPPKAIGCACVQLSGRKESFKIRGCRHRCACDTVEASCRFRVRQPVHCFCLCSASNCLTASARRTRHWEQWRSHITDASTTR